MTNPQANPLGAGGDITKAAVQIREVLNKQEQAPASQPVQNGAPVQEANPQRSQPNPAAPVEVTMLKDPATGRFVKRAEPETAEDNSPQPEGADAEDGAPADDAGKTAETPSEPSDHEELADTTDGLAAQLGMTEDELLDHLKLKVKVNGEEKPANLRELRNGYQMESDYRLKTAALADEKRAFESERSAITQQREHVASQLQPLVQTLEGMVAEDNQRLEKLLADGDLLEYERAKFAAEQRRVTHDAAKRELQRIESDRQSEARIKLEREVAENELRLGQLRPEWAKDPEAGRKAIASVRAYLKGEGVPGEAVDSLYDAISITVAEKAMKWDQLQKEKPGKLNQVKLAPKTFQRAGPAKPAEDPKRTVHRSNLNRLRKTNNVKDAAKAIASGGFLQG
jgi:hypothetical protein